MPCYMPVIYLHLWLAYVGIRIGFASQRDHWHRIHFRWVCARRGSEFAKRKSATGCVTGGRLNGYMTERARGAQRDNPLCGTPTSVNVHAHVYVHVHIGKIYALMNL